MNLRENIKKQLRLLTEQEGGMGMASGNGILDTKTNTVIPYTQEIVDALKDQGINTSNIKFDKTEPELSKPQEKRRDDKDGGDLDTLNEQLTSGWRLHSCLCGLQGTVIQNGPLAGALYCPSNPPSQGVTSTFFFWCPNCSVDGAQPSAGDQWYYDDKGTLTGNPFQNHQIANNGVTSNTNGTYWDYNSCPCGGTCPSSSPSSCTQPDFDYTSTCGAQHLGPAPGNAPSFQNWLDARWNGYQSGGCNHFQSVINWITPQLTTATGNSLLRKQAKIAWAGCMQNECNC